MTKEIPPPTQQIDISMRAVKVLEEKISELDRKLELIEDNILKVNKRQNIDIKILSEKVLESEKNVSLLKKRIVEIVSDMKNFARREEVETLKKYMDYWEPLNFVTRKELEKR